MNYRGLVNSGLIFILGVIVTIVFTKIGDRVIPDDPVIIKQYSDTITLLHEYKGVPSDTSGLFGDEAQRRFVDSLRKTVNGPSSTLFKQQYNEILGVDNVIRNFKGHTTSGQTSNFEFVCPDDKTSNYIDLSINFYDKKLVDRIGCIFVTVTEHIPTPPTAYQRQIFEEAYSIKNGLNVIRIRNYTKEPNTELSVGYILKTEINKDLPRFEKVDCKY